MKGMVSIVIPAYNVAACVAGAVQSAIDQDYAHKEIIVVNDGSTDATRAVLENFGTQIRLINQANAGPSAARNCGLRAAEGEFIAFLDGDDVWMPGKLSAQVSHLSQHLEFGGVYTRWHVWRPDAEGRFHKPVLSDDVLQAHGIDEALSGWLYNRLLFDCHVLTTTVMLRRAVCRDVGEFDESMHNGEDYDYWLRVARVAQLAKLTRIGALYRIAASSASHRPRDQNSEYEVLRRTVDRWGLVGPDGETTDAKAMDARLDALVMEHGYVHLHAGNPAIANDAFQTLLKESPFNLRLWVAAFRARAKIRVQRR